MSKTRINLALASDAYKQTHWMQYPPGTQHVYSYLESRGGQFANTTFFGLQYILKEYFTGQVIQPWMLTEAEAEDKELFGNTKMFNKKGFTHILNKHKGRWPIRVKAVPEGMSVPVGNVLMTVENTDPVVPFVTNFSETMLMQVWYPTTVCTVSWYVSRLISKFAEKTGTTTNPFHLNDFGFRGCSSYESAMIGGASHLVNFLGTDTVPAIQFLKKYYHGKSVGYSVFATEHSTTTIWGEEHELDAYEHFLKVAPSEAIVSLVIDSWDTLNAVAELIGVQLKEKVLARKGKLVIRPDSGNPVIMSVECLQMLWNRFGGTTNEKGFKVLNPKVGVIYGDGINYTSIGEILEAVVKAGFCVSNIVFGMGGALLQQVNRDTQKFAFKCSNAKVNGENRDVYKRPKTDAGKNSKKGRLKLVQAPFGVAITQTEDAPGEDLLQTVFENGELLRSYTLDEVRAQAAK